MALNGANTKFCFACYNKTSFKRLIRCFQGEYKDVSTAVLQESGKKENWGHIVCGLFHLEVDIIHSPSSQDPTLRTIMTSARKIKEDCYLEDCAICNRSHHSQCMMPCLFKKCNKLFHYECAFAMKDLKKMKITMKSANFQRFGCACASHSNADLEQQLKERPNIASVEFIGNFDILNSYDNDELEIFLTPLKSPPTQNGYHINDSLPNDISSAVVKDIIRPPFNSDNELLKPSSDTLTENKRAPPAKIESYNTFDDFFDSPSESKMEGDEYEKLNTDSFPLLFHKENSQSVYDHRFEKLPEFPDSADNKDKNVKREMIFNSYLQQVQNDPKPSIGENVEKDKIPEVSPTPLDFSNVSGELLSRKFLATKTPAQEPDETDSITDSKKKKKTRYTDLSDMYNYRKEKNLTQNTTYNLRTEVKGNKMLDFYDKITKENFSNVKAKSKDPTVIKNRREDDETKPDDYKKRQYWQEVNETYFRKLTAEELQQLTPSAVDDAFSVINQEILEIDNAQKSYDNFSNSYQYQRVPALQKVLSNKDCIHVVWNTKEEMPDNTRYVASYQLKKMETNNFETIKRADTPKLKNYDVIQSTDSALLHSFRDQGIKAPLSLHHEVEDGPTTEKFKFGQIMQLKSVEAVTLEDFKELVSKQVFQREYGDQLKTIKLAGKSEDQDDEILEELLFLHYYQNTVLVPDNNAKRDAIRTKTKSDEARVTAVGKLQDKAKQIESELKFKIILKFLREGVRDKSQATINSLYLKNHDENPIPTLETSLPKATELLKNDKFMLEICQSLDAKFKNSLKGVLRKVPKLETDCSICFNNKSSDNNPIIYCGSCDMAFHQYCYGVAHVPNEDFYCDVCVATENNYKKVRHLYTNGNRAKKLNGKVHCPYLCRLCSSTDFPLRKVRKNEWYHLTCLIAHRLVSYKNSEYVVKSSEDIENLTEANLANDRRCVLCQKTTGLCIPCAGTTKGKKCDCHFHPLCAYIDGMYLELAEEDTKNGASTSQNLFKIYCNGHTPHPERDLMKQKYYRRFAINYNNTTEYKSFEDFKDKQMEAERNAHQDLDPTDDSRSSKNTSDKHNGNGNISNKRKTDQSPSNEEETEEYDPLKHGPAPSKKVKK